MSARSKLCKLLRDSDIEYNFAVHKFQFATGAWYGARDDKLTLASLQKRANTGYRRLRGWTIADWSQHLGPDADEMDGVADDPDAVDGLKGGGVGDDSNNGHPGCDLCDADVDADDVCVVVPGFRRLDGSDGDADSNESASEGEPGWASDVQDEDEAEESDDDESPSRDGSDVAMDPGGDTGTDGTVNGQCPCGETGDDAHMADGLVDATPAAALPEASGGLSGVSGAADAASWRDALVRSLRDAVGEADLESFSLRGLRDALRSDRFLHLPDACTDYVELLKAIAVIWRASTGVASGSDEPLGGGQARANRLRAIVGVSSLTWGALDCRDWPRMSLKELRHGVEKQLRRAVDECLAERATVVELIAEALSIEDRCGTSDQLFSSAPLVSDVCVACVETQKEHMPVFHQCCRPCDPVGSRFCGQHAKSRARRLDIWDADPFHRHLPYNLLKAGRRACMKRRQGTVEAGGRKAKTIAREGRVPVSRERLLLAARTTMAGGSPMTTTASCLLSNMRSVGALPQDAGPVDYLDVFAVMVDIAREYEQATAENENKRAETFGRQLRHHGFELLELDEESADVLMMSNDERVMEVARVCSEHGFTTVAALVRACREGGLPACLA